MNCCIQLINATFNFRKKTVLNKMYSLYTSLFKTLNFKACSRLIIFCINK